MIWNRAQQSLQNIIESQQTTRPERVLVYHNDNDVTEKKDGKKPKLKFAFQRLALEPGEEERKTNSINYLADVMSKDS